MLKISFVSISFVCFIFFIKKKKKKFLGGYHLKTTVTFDPGIKMTCIEYQIEVVFNPHKFG